jgi:uncharacterized UBP type Zn finger protein
MYNELTGHGRPMKRVRVDAESPEWREEEEEGDEDTTVFSTMRTEDTTIVFELESMGFPQEWCARALLETDFNVDASVFLP